MLEKKKKKEKQNINRTKKLFDISFFTTIKSFKNNFRIINITKKLKYKLSNSIHEFIKLINIKTMN